MTTLLLGAPGAITALAAKESANVLVAADSHGRFLNLCVALERFGAKCDAFVFCGDGMSDIARLVERAAGDEVFRAALPPVIGIVEGNNDARRYPVLNMARRGTAGSGEPYYTELEVPIVNTIEAAGKKVLFTHGHRASLYIEENLKEAALSAGCSAAFYGHTHIPHEMYGRVFTLNPGSLARGRFGYPPSFAIVRLSRDSSDVGSVFYEITADGCRPFLLDDIM